MIMFDEKEVPATGSEAVKAAEEVKTEAASETKEVA